MQKRNFSPEARERIREAQLKRWHARAPFSLKLIEESGLEYAGNGEVVYLLLRGQKIPAGCKSLGIHDHWAVVDRHGKVAVGELTREQAEQVRASLQAPFDAATTTGATTS